MARGLFVLWLIPRLRGRYHWPFQSHHSPPRLNSGVRRRELLRESSYRAWLYGLGVEVGQAHAALYLWVLLYGGCRAFFTKR